MRKSRHEENGLIHKSPDLLLLLRDGCGGVGWASGWGVCCCACGGDFPGWTRDLRKSRQAENGLMHNLSERRQISRAFASSPACRLVAPDEKYIAS